MFAFIKFSSNVLLEAESGKKSMYTKDNMKLYRNRQMRISFVRDTFAVANWFFGIDFCCCPAINFMRNQIFDLRVYF